MNIRDKSLVVLLVAPLTRQKMKERGITVGLAMDERTRDSQLMCTVLGL